MTIITLYVSVQMNVSVSECLFVRAEVLEGSALTGC